MKLKILIVSLALLFSLIMITAVTAVPETAIPVTAIQQAYAKTVYYRLLLNNGSIFFYSGVGTGAVTLHIGSDAYLMKLTEQFNTTINTKTDQGESNRRILWEYVVNGEVVGAFEGESKGVTLTSLYNPATGFPRGAFSTNIYHTVLHGSGIFEDQMLKLDGIRPTVDPSMPVTTPANPTVWEGILLVH
ncbi:MAG TPA: hypothetical protein VK209_11145 [Candidatus Sulfotelmatobacter sp.]|nr:hypothetical protein [Candidatus Sulfotelmatobacter sp.]